jgi:hypothetical protein
VVVSTVLVVVVVGRIGTGDGGGQPVGSAVAPCGFFCF